MSNEFKNIVKTFGYEWELALDQYSRLPELSFDPSIMISN